MSLLIHRENQELLWNIVNKNKVVHNFFQRIPEQDKYNWFQNIISEFYNKYRTYSISSNDLSSINKEILRFMINNANTNTENMNQRHFNNENMGEPYQKESKKNEYISEFEQRQQSYENMIKKEQPKDIDFSINLDENQGNMEELIKKQQEQRNLDLEAFGSQNNKNINIETISENKTNTFTNTDTYIEKQNKGIENIESLFMQQEELLSYKNQISILFKEVEEIKKLLKNKSE
jgi:hypothetical protein